MDPEVMTWTEIGKRLGVSPQYAQQLYNQAMRKIRNRLRTQQGLAESLYDFLEGAPTPTGYRKEKHE
jgi:DNA-directed RNA polymerase sigma subunit (sigma70/sigma32)